MPGGNLRIVLRAVATRTLIANEVGLCNLPIASPVAFDCYEESRDTGAFILVDRYSNETAAAGIIQFALRRATNIQWEPLAPTKQLARSLSGSGPVSSGSPVRVRKVNNCPSSGRQAFGDRLSHLHARRRQRPPCFTDADRVEDIRRAGEVAKLFVEVGLIVLGAFISPF